MNLNNKNLSYMIMSSEKIEDVISVLYAKDFKLTELETYKKGEFGRSVLTYANIGNNELRQEALFLMENFKVSYIIVKYLEESEPIKLYPDGREEFLKIDNYNTDDDKKSYLLNGLSFSFIKRNRYYVPKKKSDFKEGMVVEYKNLEKWNKHKIKDSNLEWDKMFKLLTKYNKVRILSN